MLGRDQPTEKARLCREQAGLTANSDTAAVLLALARHYEAEAERGKATNDHLTKGIIGGSRPS